MRRGHDLTTVLMNSQQLQLFGESLSQTDHQHSDRDGRWGHGSYPSLGSHWLLGEGGVLFLVL